MALVGVVFGKENALEGENNFETVGIYRTDTEHRAYTVYTDTEDTGKMIEHARELVKNTPKPKLEVMKQQIVVHFFSDRENTPQNTTLTNYDEGMWLQVNGIEKYKPYMLGTYQKALNGAEIWYKGYSTVEDKFDGETISVK